MYLQVDSQPDNGWYFLPDSADRHDGLISSLVTARVTIWVGAQVVTELQQAISDPTRHTIVWMKAILLGFLLGL